jgi:uncharacterized protein (TIGR00255 family)
MVKSMTGFGRCTKQLGDFEISFEVKAVNNRYLDCNVRLPRIYSYMEESIKKLVGSYTSRGKVDVYLSVDRVVGSSTQIVSDMGLIESYLEAFKNISETFGLKNDVSVSTVSRLPEVFSKRITEDDEDSMWEMVKEVANEALASFNSMRATEGESLKKDIEYRLDLISEMAEKIKNYSPSYLEQYRQRLETKIKEVLGSDTFDQSRILTEVAILSEKLDTQEELTRLASHISQFKQILSQKEPAGRKLDFLIQEMNREANTIGSKSNDKEITSMMLDLKAEIEKIREQVQNIE